MLKISDSVERQKFVKDFEVDRKLSRRTWWQEFARVMTGDYRHKSSAEGIEGKPYKNFEGVTLSWFLPWVDIDARLNPEEEYA